MRVGRIGYLIGTAAALAAIGACSLLGEHGFDLPPSFFFCGVVAVALWCWFLTVLRCHDFDESAWINYFIDQVPVIGQLWATLELYLKPGTPGPNRYGDPPLF